MDIYKRIAYLHQVQDLLNQMNTTSHSMSSTTDTEQQADLSNSNTEVAPKTLAADCENKSLIKLNSFYGYLTKEISMKHNIQVLNCDKMKQFRCKRCFCLYDFDKITKNGLLKRRSKKRYLQIHCPQCGYARKIIFRHEAKTKFEKYFAQQQIKSK